MFRLRLSRRFSALFTCRPIVDNVCWKGEHWRNICTISNNAELRPFTSWFSMRKVSKLDGLFSPQPKIHALPLSTSNILATADPLSSSELKKSIDHLTDQFMEARELLEDARESVGTVYFSDDMEEASDAVKNTLDEYQELLKRLSDEQKQDVLRTIGLKMEELKAQQQAINEDS